MGDPDRLTQLVLDRSASLLLYARQWLDAASADDVVQQAMTALLGQPKVLEDPVAWTYRAVRNAAIDLARANARRARREQTVAMDRPEWFDERPDALLDAAAAEQALRLLPDSDREILVLRIWGELGFAQIALIAGISLSGAQKRYMAALKDLRQTLENPCKTK